jgi:two-component system, NtrC family, sensor histidine kinase HydH
MSTLTLWAAVHLLAAASGLVVIALALTRGQHSPLRRPLALLAANQFAWNATSFGSALTHLSAFAWLGAIAAPLFPPVALHFVLTYLGRRRQLRRLLLATYAVFALQALVAAFDFAQPGEHVPGGLQTFAALLLTSSAPVATLALILVVTHLKRSTSDLERLRTWLLLTALIIVIFCLVTEPLADLGLNVPRLSTLGSFAFNAILARITVGLGLFRNDRPLGAALGQAILLALFFTVTSLVVFNTLSAQTTLLITALTAVFLVLALLGWLFVSSAQASRARLERFASLGRFSAQMAHDLKNPLAAAKGAAEYLTEELRRAGGGPNQDFAQLVVGQLDRLHAVIDRYQRLSKLEPQLETLDVNRLVTKTLSLQQFATGGSIAIETRLGNPLPSVQGDPDLLASALENLVKNACEAMAHGGTLTVTTRLADNDEPTVVLAVSDTGTGFDPRAREQAFELFFTTKASGSGLGLAFVRQVARAHGGEASLASKEGVGSTVTLTLPISFRKSGTSPPQSCEA